MTNYVLGQVVPASINTDIDLYTVPTGKSAVTSTLNVCNQTGSNITYRTRVRVNGAAAAAKQYLDYDVQLPPGASDKITIGMTLGAGDVVSVQASATGVSFTLFGSEA